MSIGVSIESDTNYPPLYTLDNFVALVKFQYLTAFNPSKGWSGVNGYHGNYTQRVKIYFSDAVWLMELILALLLQISLHRFVHNINAVLSMCFG